MSPTVKSAYAGGYSDTIKRQLENVVIPGKVKCATCKRIRMQSAFSKRQLDILRNAIVVQGHQIATRVGHAKCRACVGAQTVELKCSICDKMKSLDEFAKSQRQDRDLARCLNCVQSHVEAEPVLDEYKLLTESELSTIPGTVAASQIDDASLIESGRRLNINDTPHYPYGSSTYGEKDDDDDDLSIGGGVWIEREEENTSKGNGRSFTGSDPNGIDHHQSGSPLGAPESIHTGWASWGVGRAASSPLNKKESKFAKLPSKRFEKSEVPTMRVPEPTGPTIPSDDEGEEETGIEDFL